MEMVQLVYVLVECFGDGVTSVRNGGGVVVMMQLVKVVVKFCRASTPCVRNDRDVVVSVQLLNVIVWSVLMMLQLVGVMW